MGGPWCVAPQRPQAPSRQTGSPLPVPAGCSGVPWEGPASPGRWRVVVQREMRPLLEVATSPVCFMRAGGGGQERRGRRGQPVPPKLTGDSEQEAGHQSSLAFVLLSDLRPHLAPLSAALCSELLVTLT